MLRTRVVTAVLLLAVLLPVLYLGNFLPFAIVLSLFFAGACWESLRLFHRPAAKLVAVIWTGMFVVVLNYPQLWTAQLFALSSLLWLLRFGPALKFGLPALAHKSNLLLGPLYNISIFACFIAIAALFQHAPMYLLSVMLMVWVADVGAYFAGKAFGKHKLAPSISPGKSWEGAIGGWLAVLTVGGLLAFQSYDTFPLAMRARFGVPGLLVILSLLSVASVCGDLFESLLKRRANVKDSSGLLPGHGGILDRVDALIPVLPLAALLEYLR